MSENPSLTEVRSETGASRPAWAGLLAPVAAAAAAAAAAPACQSYEPSPLETEAHREAWHGRTLEAASLEAFLERLERDGDEQAARFDATDGLTLDEGQLVALVFNPGLRLERLRVGRAAATAENAGLWADPELFASVLRVTEGVPDPWIITPGLTFTLPISGRLGAERDLADASHRAAQRRLLEAEWSTWYDVRRAWIEWSAARHRAEETARFVEAMEPLVGSASKLAAAGELTRTQATLFLVEQAQRENQLRRLRGDVAAAEQRLRAQLGLAPEAPVSFVPCLGALGEDEQVEPETVAGNPVLVRLREEFQVAEEDLRHEVRKQYPDLTLGPLFESDRGQSSIGFIGAIPIPMLNANRQAIAQATVQRELARAAFETEYELLVGRMAAASARSRALSAQRTDLEQVLVPLVERQLADALQLTELGEESSLVLFQSLVSAQDTKLDLIATRAEEALARAERDYLKGPRTGPTEDNP